LAAAQAKFEAAAPGAALELLATAEMCPLDALQRARVERLRAQLTFAHRRDLSAPSLHSLLGAARRLESLDAQLARATYLDALRAGIFAGKLLDAGELYEAAESARTAPPGPNRPRAVDLLLDGLAVRFTDGHEAAVQPLRRALEAFLLERPHDTDDARQLWLAWPVAYDLWDDETWHELSVRLVDFARQVGALTILPIALVYRAQLHVQAGQLAAATALLDEVDVINETISSTPLVYNTTRSSARLVIASWQGREPQALELIEDSIQEAAARGEGRAISLSEFARAVLYNGLGRYDLALAAARRVCEHDDLALLAWGLVELVEASARCNQSAEADAALRRLAERTVAVGTDWALGVEARCRALVSTGATAESSYREAIDRLGRTRIRLALGRAHLLYGEWLRREGRRVDAREQLRLAHDMLTEMGLEGFAERARRELRATGEKVRKRIPETQHDLTPQESQIVRLAGEGATNSEIASQMFISERTVEWHMRKVFAKLGISSRRQLRRQPRPNS
jgi:DNA-binding CsgD family transcriptional regulator/tetratricopeptide (TPR) repeat protein